MSKILNHIKNDLKNHISYPYLLNSKKNKLNLILFLKSYLNIDFRIPLTLKNITRSLEFKK